MKNASQAPDISLLIVVLPLHYFGRGVSYSANKGLPHFVGARRRYTFGESEIRNFDVKLIVDHDIGRVQVSVDNLLLHVQIS